MNNRIAVITGVTGFIGSALANSLLLDGFRVYGIGRDFSSTSNLLHNNQFIPIIMDLEQSESLEDYIREDAIDYFFHLAHRGVNGKEKADYNIQLSNLQLSCKMVTIAKLINCKRFVFSGSVDEYQACKVIDHQYTKPTNSRIYAYTKLASEGICKDLCYSFGIEYVGVLPALVFGPNNKTNILPNTIIRASINHCPVNLIKGDSPFDMIYIDDCIKGFRKVAEKGKSGESYYIGNRRIKSFRKCVEEICDVIDSDVELCWGAYDESAPSLNYNDIDLQKAFIDTGFQVETSFKKSIIETYKWLVNHY